MSELLCTHIVAYVDLLETLITVLILVLFRNSFIDDDPGSAIQSQTRRKNIRRRDTETLDSNKPSSPDHSLEEFEAHLGSGEPSQAIYPGGKSSLENEERGTVRNEEDPWDLEELHEQFVSSSYDEPTRKLPYPPKSLSDQYSHPKSFYCLTTAADISPPSKSPTRSRKDNGEYVNIFFTFNRPVGSHWFVW